MRQTLIGLLLLVCLACGMPPGWCSASDQGWKAVGVRGGFSSTPKHDFFHQYEVYTTYGLPWSWRAESGWGVAMELNAAVGALHAAGETGIIGAIGPGVIFDKAGKGLAFDLGGDVNVLSRRNFGSTNLNGNPMFDGHVGVAYRFVSGPGVSYRFQHMSNGGLGLNGDGNIGLDLHMFGVSWNF
jgi:hypothetical protein